MYWGWTGADNLALIVFLEIELPARLKLEVVNVESAREFALDSNGRHLLLVWHAHGVFLSRALGGFCRCNPDVTEGRVSEQQRHEAAG
jgi:hypothetical protein